MKLSESDWERLETIVATSIEWWVGISTYLMLASIEDLETNLMATLNDLITEDTQLAAEVADLITAFNAAKTGTLSAEQQAQVDQISASLAQMSTDIAAANPPSETPPPIPPP